MTAIAPADRESFAVDLLTILPGKVNEDTESFLVNWMGLENTQAGYNPLATTQYMPGATEFNSVGVRNYPNRTVGLQATKETLLNGFYPNIVKALEDGDPYAAQDKGELSAELHTWSGGGYSHVPGTSKVQAPAPAGASPISFRYPLLKESGTESASVKFVQFLLGMDGHSVTVDGVFGPETLSAVRGFQSSHGLAVDGIVGPQTWLALVSFSGITV